jgi:hypothetical protein
MIKIKLTEKNINLTKIRTYQFDTLKIGNDPELDLILKAEGIPRVHSILQIKEDSLVVIGNHSTAYYFVNGKKFTGQRSLKPNDCINIENFDIEILEFKRTEISNKSQFLKDQYLDAQEKDGRVSSLIDVIGQEIMKIEESRNDV